MEEAGCQVERLVKHPGHPSFLTWMSCPWAMTAHGLVLLAPGAPKQRHTPSPPPTCPRAPVPELIRQLQAQMQALFLPAQSLQETQEREKKIRYFCRLLKLAGSCSQHSISLPSPSRMQYECAIHFLHRPGFYAHVSTCSYPGQSLCLGLPGP